MSAMRSYDAARGLFSFLAFIAWSAVVVGVIAAFGGAQMRTGFGGAVGIMGALPGIGIAILGLFQVAVVQAARATVDTAEYTQQMLKIARDQLDVSKQSLKQGYEAAATYSAKTEQKTTTQGKGYSAKNSKEKTGPKIEVSKSIDHKGETIKQLAGSYHYKGASFRRLDQVRAYIDVQIEGKHRKSLSKP